MPIMVNDDLPGSRQDVADVPEVVRSQEARGWRVATDDEVAELEQAERETPSVQRVPAGPDEDAPPEWVDMVHPDLPGQPQRVPNNAAAISGQRENGWDFPPPPEDAVKEELHEIRPRGGRPTKAEREQAEAQAAANAAATNEPPGSPGPGETVPATGDDDQKE